MKERPILFSSPMVLALLREPDPKTMTRRLRGLDRVNGLDSDQWAIHLETADSVVFRRKGTDGQRTPSGPLIEGVVYCDNEIVIKKPCVVGDHLWVREACVSTDDSVQYIADRSVRLATAAPTDEAWHRFRNYRGKPAPGDLFGHVVPGIHMPRWASRITLEVTGVRVERLQDISEEDARAEGFKETRERVGNGINWQSARGNLRLLWDQINGPESWEANPWVWVIEFKRIEQKA